MQAAQNGMLMGTTKMEKARKQERHFLILTTILE